MVEEHIGRIEHYFPKAHAAVVRVDRGELKVGDTIHVVGRGVDFTEAVVSLEIDHKPVLSAHEGEDVGLLVDSRARAKADVFLVHPTAHPGSGRDEVWDPSY